MFRSLIPFSSSSAQSQIEAEKLAVKSLREKLAAMAEDKKLAELRKKENLAVLTKGHYTLTILTLLKKPATIQHNQPLRV